MIYGGKGSAKTFSIAQLFIILGYIEKSSAICYRKEQTTIKKTLKESLKKARKSVRFDDVYEVMDFKFLGIDGQEIILNGLDDETKVKGIENYKYLLFDELDHFLQEEWTQANLSLRGMPNQKLFGTWNPVDEHSWIKKEIDTMSWVDMPKIINGNPLSELCETSEVKLSKDGSVLLIRTTYPDNKWMVGGNGYGYRDENLITQYENQKAINYNFYRVNVLGEWGKAEVQRPFAYNFKIDKHVKATAVFNPHLPVYFSIDFNVEPFVCLAAHIWRDGQGDHLHFFREIIIEKNGDVHEMCDRLLDTFGVGVMANCIFTGDATSRKKEVTQRNNIDAWTIINSRFKLGQRLKLPRANPRVAETRHLLNTILAFHPDVQFNPEMKRTIFELQYSEVDEEGEPVKKNRNDEKQRMDALDDVRYMVNSFLRSYLDRYKIK